MPKTSAGLLAYRYKNNKLQVLLVHPGGPFWKNKDLGAWSVPKGEIGPDEEPLTVAKREFVEETGFKPLAKEFAELNPVKQPGGKTVLAWTFQGDFDAGEIKSNTFEMEWPPGSGKYKKFPEIDKAGWFGIVEAKQKILRGQINLIEQLKKRAGRPKRRDK